MQSQKSGLCSWNHGLCFVETSWILTKDSVTLLPWRLFWVECWLWPGSQEITNLMLLWWSFVIIDVMFSILSSRFSFLLFMIACWWDWSYSVVAELDGISASLSILQCAWTEDDVIGVRRIFWRVCELPKTYLIGFEDMRPSDRHIKIYLGFSLMGLVCTWRCTKPGSVRLIIRILACERSFIGCAECWSWLFFSCFWKLASSDWTYLLTWLRSLTKPTTLSCLVNLWWLRVKKIASRQ